MKLTEIKQDLSKIKAIRDKYIGKVIYGEDLDNPIMITDIGHDWIDGKPSKQTMIVRLWDFTFKHFTMEE